MNTEHTDNNAGIKEVSPDTFVDSSGHQLSEQQVRAVVTPHVFAVAPELIGQPLAKPARRGVAMLIDGFFIAALTSGSLIFVLPMLGYLAWSRRQAAKTGQMALLLTAALVLFITNNWLPSLASKDQIQQFTGSAIFVSSALKLAQESCDTACARNQLMLVVPQLQAAQLKKAQQKDVLEGLLDASDITDADKTVLYKELLNQLQTAPDTAVKIAQSQPVKASWWQRLQQSDHSVLKWIRGILADLGIGFGWAIGYFTLFIAWNNGQTIGKKLCGIRVVQLDNKPLSLWGAFGRQGGYSAGFATGLLGFLQIYWDPNRQAIQDKLADTLVLRLKE
jgi:uncharacterized RDD family membrane protein YckC